MTLAPEKAIYSQENSFTTIIIILAWSVLHSILCLTGNTLVLIAITRYRAIRLDPVSLVLIEHLATADILYMFTHAALALPGYIAEEWILGGFMCGAVTVMTYLPAIASMYLICGLNVNKMLTLKYPLKSILKSRKTGHILAVCVWAWGATAIAVTWLITKWDFEFRLNILHCLEVSKHEHLKQLIISIVLMTPIVIILVTTLRLMRFVQQARGLQMQGALPLVLVSLVFMVSWLPYGVYNAVVSFLQDDDIVQYSRVLATVDIISVFTMYFNFSSNPIIYYWTIRSFKEFVNGTVRRKSFNHNINYSTAS